MGHRLEGGCGGDVDDCAAPALAHRWQVPGRQAHHRKTVEAHLLLQAFGGVVGDVLPGAEAGIVDQDVNVQTSAVGLVPQSLGCVRLGQVQGDGGDLHTVLLAELLGQSVDLVLPAGHQNEIVPPGRVAAGELLTDPRRRSGDECDHGCASS